MDKDPSTTDEKRQKTELKKRQNLTSLKVKIARNSRKDEPEPKEPQIPSVGSLELFKFSTPFDILLIVVAMILAILGSAGFPIMCIMFGEVLQAFVDFDTYSTACNFTSLHHNVTSAGVEEEVAENLRTAVNRFGWGMCVIGFATWLVVYIFTTCLNTAAARQVFRIRAEFFKAVLRQDIGWYDTTTTTDFASRMTDDLNKLEDGIGEKIGMLAYFLGIFLVSHIVAFVYGWELTLVLLCSLPLMSLAGALLAQLQTSLAEKESTAYARAGAIAEEVLSGIRTVVAFGGQTKELERFAVNLKSARSSGILRSVLTGLSSGITLGVMFGVYGIGFWFGIKLILDDLVSDVCQACGPGDLDCLAACVKHNARDLLTIFYCVLNGYWYLGQSAPFVEAFSKARSAARVIYDVIDRTPAIDSGRSDGRVLAAHLQGPRIDFSNVVFTYPARPGVAVLNGLNLTIPGSKTVALVGSSGCGKSTCIQLIQRFYDPQAGALTIDGVDIRELNLAWLRSNIGIVGQEPVLFDCSIRENIRLGKPEATDADIEEACREANALDFILRLPDQLDTKVGERGTQLSGGQKQRIAIARALVRNPAILLLDEATSALDNESESIVQSALDRASTGRTTIVVAHRLSTVITADMIVAMDNGRVVEVGTHTELMAKQGLYFRLVQRQVEDPSDDSRNRKNLPKDNNKQLLITARTQLPKDIEVEAGALVKNSGKFENTRHAAEEAEVDWEEDDENGPRAGLWRLMGENRPEWFYIIVGALCACGMGAVMPIFAVIFAQAVGILSYTDFEAARSESAFYGVMFAILGLGCCLLVCLQGLMFGISGENLTVRLRKKAFTAMMNQEMGWYDRRENSTGALCARLSGDASKVQGATGARVGTVLQGIAGIVIAVTLGLAYNWKLGLVCAVFLPVVVLGLYLELRLSMGLEEAEKTAFEESSKLAIEAIAHVRTVQGLCCEGHYVQRFVSLLEAPHRQALRRNHKKGLTFGYAKAAMFFGYGVTLFYGGVLVSSDCLPYEVVFLVVNAVIGGAEMIGFSFAFTSDFNRAVVAGGRILGLLDRRPTIDSNPAAGIRLPKVAGNVGLKEAGFFYESRPTVKVLDNLVLAIKAGQRIALVGESGCGKSTIMQLIQRFYDLTSGSLTLEQEDMRALNLPLVRSNLGIVSQEPTLFDRTIAENIQYGDNSREVTMEEVIQAARQANIHSFISSLPSGYDTRVGTRGVQLSGGQKQRIAIARALVRNPAILLLDEATSALDMESEKVVQEALDRAQVGRTCITIAHRLSTIKDSDVIYVMSQGSVVEYGTHQQLLSNSDGHYFKLWNAAAS